MQDHLREILPAWRRLVAGLSPHVATTHTRRRDGRTWCNWCIGNTTATAGV